MTLDLALRATEILLGLAFLQKSLEHIWLSPADRSLFIPMTLLSLTLVAGLGTPWVLLGLSVHSVFVLHRFAGPYNGGSDRMGLLVLYCLTLASWMPSERAQEIALGYLAVQVILSYFISGRVKIVNPDWRSGRALQDVFLFSAYPVSEALRALAERPNLLWAASWAVILLEILFPLTLLSHPALVVALTLAAAFHIANACLFGLNRFVWAWLAAYPSLLWFQDRVFGTFV